MRYGRLGTTLLDTAKAFFFECRDASRFVSRCGILRNGFVVLTEVILEAIDHALNLSKRLLIRRTFHQQLFSTEHLRNFC